MKQEILNLASLGLAIASISYVAFDKLSEPSRVDALQMRLNRADKMIQANTYVDCLRERIYLHPNISLEDCYNTVVKVAAGLEK